jgi:hypothetical protein
VSPICGSIRTATSRAVDQDTRICGPVRSDDLEY